MNWELLTAAFVAGGAWEQFRRLRREVRTALREVPDLSRRVERLERESKFPPGWQNRGRIMPQFDAAERSR